MPSLARSVASTSQSDAPAFTSGSVDIYGFHEAAGGIFFTGWIDRLGFEHERPERLLAHFADNATMVCPLGTYTYRNDVGDLGIGFTFFAACQHNPTSPLVRLEWWFSTGARSIQPTRNVRRLAGAQLHDFLVGQLTGGPEKSNRQLLCRLLSGDRDAATQAWHSATTCVVDWYGYHHTAGCWF